MPVIGPGPAQGVLATDSSYEPASKKHQVKFRSRGYGSYGEDFTSLLSKIESSPCVNGALYVAKGKYKGGGCCGKCIYIYTSPYASHSFWNPFLQSYT